MRLWTLHPSYLDVKGLLAAWREGLLAQKALEGKTKGYANHPQLNRFRAASDTMGLIGAYLTEIQEEAQKRGYKFNKEKIHGSDKETSEKAKVAKRQIEYEFELLKFKLEKRDKDKLAELDRETAIRINRAFEQEEGEKEEWEKVKEPIMKRLGEIV